MIQFWRIIASGFRNFLRNAWLSSAATAVMTVTLTLILVSAFLSSALNATVKGIVNKIDLSIYLNDNITPEQTQELQKRLQGLENVESVRFISKADAEEIFRRQNPGDPTLLEGLKQAEGALPASFQVKTKDQNPQKLEQIVHFTERPDVKPMVAKLSYQDQRKETIDKIIRVANVLRTVGLIASSIFLVISVLIIFNTIRMAIFTRRNEIEIMRLVGATNWFIRGPFVFEGALYGIIAAGIATALGYTLLAAAGGRLAIFLGDVGSTVAFFKAYPVLVLVSELLLGVIIGTISSLLAMTRYLKL
jgi:cell division transport system permease protein